MRHPYIITYPCHLWVNIKNMLLKLRKCSFLIILICNGKEGSFTLRSTLMAVAHLDVEKRAIPLGFKISLSIIICCKISALTMGEF